MTWLTRNVRVLSAVSFLQDTASELLYPLLPIYLTTVLCAPPAVVGAIEGVAEGAASVTKLAVGPLGDRYAKRPLIASERGKRFSANGLSQRLLQLYDTAGLDRATSHSGRCTFITGSAHKGVNVHALAALAAVQVAAGSGNLK
jgi:hypothetical protein